MDAEELAFAGIARQAELIRAGEVSSRELTDLYLGRIERLDAELRTFTQVLAERAMADAEGWRVMRFERLGRRLALAGLSVALLAAGLLGRHRIPPWNPRNSRSPALRAKRS